LDPAERQTGDHDAGEPAIRIVGLVNTTFHKTFYFYVLPD
jgi:hypothetical protein